MSRSTPIVGDVLIVSRDGRHFVSIFPERAHLSFKLLSQALEFARRWTGEHTSASAWHQKEGSQAVVLADLPRHITQRQAGLGGSSETT